MKRPSICIRKSSISGWDSDGVSETHSPLRKLKNFVTAFKNQTEVRGDLSNIKVKEDMIKKGVITPVIKEKKLKCWKNKIVEEEDIQKMRSVEVTVSQSIKIEDNNTMFIWQKSNPFLSNSLKAGHHSRRQSKTQQISLQRIARPYTTIKTSRRKSTNSSIHNPQNSSIESEVIQAVIRHHQSFKSQQKYKSQKPSDFLQTFYATPKNTKYIKRSWKDRFKLRSQSKQH